MLAKLSLHLLGSARPPVVTSTRAVVAVPTPDAESVRCDTGAVVKNAIPVELTRMRLVPAADEMYASPSLVVPRPGVMPTSPPLRVPEEAVLEAPPTISTLPATALVVPPLPDTAPPVMVTVPPV